MQSDEFQALKDSISIIGVQNPITLLDGMVIDGWHRYCAANELSMQCPTKPLGEVDPVDFVKSQNDARRNVTASQRASAITAIYAWKPTNIGRPAINSRGEPGSPLAKTNVELAEIANTTVRTIQQAKAVHAKATPEVKESVRAGTMSLKKAAETINPPKEKAETIPPMFDSETAELSEKNEILSEENDRLNDRLAVVAMDATPEERTAAADTIEDLRAQIKTLTATLSAATASRDSYMRENQELKKQCSGYKRHLDKIKKG